VIVSDRKNTGGSNARGLAAPSASVIIVNTDELHHLRRCLPSVMRQSHQDYEVLVVDNASTDGSVQWLRKEFPQVRVVQNDTNLGYTGANNVGFNQARGSYLAVLNPLLPLQDDRSIGLTTSKVMFMGEPDKINTCGNMVTFAGMAFCLGMGQPSAQFQQSREVASVSGAAFAIRRDVLEEIGDFEERFFIYLEDTDLSWRARVAGYRCLFVSTSIAYHDYAMRFSPAKYFREECNRHFMLLKNLEGQSLLVLWPSLLVGEAMAWGYAFYGGIHYLKAKLRSYKWIVKNVQEIRSARAGVQSLRRVPDRSIVNGFVHRIPFEQLVGRRLATILDVVFTPMLFVTSRLALLFLRS
jgi:GT2 family glycosyltransferase